jgi:hypothetical protein
MDAGVVFGGDIPRVEPNASINNQDAYQAILQISELASGTITGCERETRKVR